MFKAAGADPGRRKHPIIKIPLLLLPLCHMPGCTGFGPPAAGFRNASGAFAMRPKKAVDTHTVPNRLGHVTWGISGGAGMPTSLPRLSVTPGSGGGGRMQITNEESTADVDDARV